ncbi:hypothetical protein RJT34_32520 [Clitoria ternatea]|uniref:Phytocyanin domain-containing protein n=1 Tax=Clitoria ternatea TaxID=43366 RepID=A0AAN9I3V6_CLITE
MAATRILFVLVVTMMPLPHTAEAAEHYVNWIIPIASPSFYSSFAANNTFKLDDTLVFEFKTGAHNVVTLSKKNFENCNVNEKMESFDTGPARITLNRTGEFYFACAFTSHCTLAQKLSINVTEEGGSSSSLAPMEAPPPSASGTTMSLPITLSLLLLPIAINLFFSNLH